MAHKRPRHRSNRPPPLLPGEIFLERVVEITGYSPHTIYYYTSSRVDAAEQIPHTKRRRFLVFNEAEVKEWQARKDGLVPDVVEEPAMLAGASHG